MITSTGSSQVKRVIQLQKKSKSEIKKIVEEMLSLVNLKGFEKRNVSSLSR